MEKPDRQQMSDHDLLIRIDERTENMDERVDSHANRLWDLEQTHSKIMAYVVIVGATITFGLNVIFNLWDKIRWK